MKSSNVVSFLRNVTVSWAKCRTAMRICRGAMRFFLASILLTAKSRKRSGRRQMTKRVIDADGHICEPPAVWNDYIEKRHRAAAIRVERDPDGRDWISINGTMRRNLRPAAACGPWGMDEPNKVPSWQEI